MYKKVEGIAQRSLCSHYPASVIVFESLFKDLILKFSVCFLKMETTGFSLNVSSNQGWKSKPPTNILPLVPKADIQRERTSPCWASAVSLPWRIASVLEGRRVIIFGGESWVPGCLGLLSDTRHCVLSFLESIGDTPWQVFGNQGKSCMYGSQFYLLNVWP